MSARAKLLLLVIMFLVSASVSSVSAIAQISTESGTEVREFHGNIVAARTAEISPRYNGLSNANRGVWSNC